MVEPPNMAKVLVIGGRGFYGAKVVAALSSSPGWSVSVASRSASLRLDLGDPSTFEQLDGFDLIVNMSDSAGAPPDDAARHVLRRGGLWLEAGASAEVTERLLAMAEPDPKGGVLVGAGSFPGLSTALAAATLAAGPPARSLTLGVRLSPLSGAGPANVALMTASLEAPSLRWRGGRREEGPPVGDAAPLPFPSAPGARGLAVALPDGPLLRRLTGAPELVTRMALAPAWLAFNLRALAWLMARAGPLRGALRGAVTLWLLGLRAGLLRGRASPLELVAVVDEGLPGERRRALTFADGQRATAEGVAAAARLALALPERPRGVAGAMERLDPAALLAQLPG